MELKSSFAVPGLAEPSEPLATLTERGEDTITPLPFPHHPNIWEQ